MEGLKILIRNLAFILLLATFLEMLLPNRSMKGFVKVIMGLFVIAAVLNPLADFLNLDISNEVPAWVSSSSADLPVLASEGSTVNAGASAVREQYKRILENQIKILISTIDGVRDPEVTIELEKDAGGFSDYPKILQASIVFTEQSRTIRPVDPIQIGKNESGTDIEKSAKEREVQKTVAAFMQIPEEIILVKEKK